MQEMYADTIIQFWYIDASDFILVICSGQKKRQRQGAARDFSTVWFWTHHSCWFWCSHWRVHSEFGFFLLSTNLGHQLANTYWLSSIKGSLAYANWPAPPLLSPCLLLTWLPFIDHRVCQSSGHVSCRHPISPSLSRRRILKLFLMF